MNVERSRLRRAVGVVFSWAAVAGLAACGSSPAPSSGMPPPTPTHAPPPDGATFPADPQPASAPPLASGDSSPPPAPGATPQATLEANLGRAVRSNMRALQACYEQGRKRQPGLKGDFVMSFVIAPSGKVVKAESDPATTLAEPATVACMTSVVSGITSVQNPMGTEFRAAYSVNFNAPADAP